MGKINNGILGAVSGKVAGVVGGRWKDKAYLRAYTIPANPNTAAQQVQRTKFSATVNFAKPLVGQVFNSFTDKFQKSMSGFNFFIKRNIALFIEPPTWGSIKITEGPLFRPVITSITSVEAVVTINFATDLGNTGLADDQINAVVYNRETGVFFFPGAAVNRSVGAIDITVADASDEDMVSGYVFAAQSISGVLDSISDSDIGGHQMDIT